MESTRVGLYCAIPRTRFQIPRITRFGKDSVVSTTSFWSWGNETRISESSFMNRRRAKPSPKESSSSRQSSRSLYSMLRWMAVPQSWYQWEPPLWPGAGILQAESWDEVDWDWWRVLTAVGVGAKAFTEEEEARNIDKRARDNIERVLDWYVMFACWLFSSWGLAF